MHYVNRSEDIDYSDVQRVGFVLNGDGSQKISWKLTETRLGSDSVPAPNGTIAEQILVTPKLTWTGVRDELQDRITRLFAAAIASQGHTFRWSFQAQASGLPAGDITVKASHKGFEWRYAETGSPFAIAAHGSGKMDTGSGALVAFEGDIDSMRIPGGDAQVTVGLSFKRES